MSEQPRNEEKKGGGGWRELPQGFDAKKAAQQAGRPAEPQAEGEDTWILEGFEEEAPGAQANPGNPLASPGLGKAGSSGKGPGLGSVSHDDLEAEEKSPSGVVPDELFQDAAPDDAPTAGPDPAQLGKFTAVGPVGFRTEARSSWAGDDLSATQLGMDLADEERALREMELSFASGTEDVEFTLVGGEDAAKTGPNAGGSDASSKGPGDLARKRPPVAGAAGAVGAGLAGAAGAETHARPGDATEETLGADQAAGAGDQGSPFAGGEAAAEDSQSEPNELADTPADQEAPDSEPLDGEQLDAAAADGDEPLEGEAGDAAFEPAAEGAPEEEPYQEDFAEPEAEAVEAESEPYEPEAMVTPAPRRGVRWLRVAAAAVLMGLGGTVALGLPWSDSPAGETPAPRQPVAAVPRKVVRTEIARPVTRLELTPPVVNLSIAPTPGQLAGGSGSVPPVAGGPGGAGTGQPVGTTQPPMQPPPVARGEDDELLQALDKALAGVPTSTGPIAARPTDPGVVAPAPGPGEDGGPLVALLSGSRALALLRNGSFFIGKVKRVDASAVTLHLGNGELTLERATLKQLVSLGAVEYQELAQGGSVLLKNRNRLVGQILQGTQQDGVTLDLQTAKITIPKEDIEEVTTRVPAAIEFGTEDDEVWFKRELEKERDRARRASRGIDMREEGEGPAIRVLGTVEDLKAPPKSK